MLDPQAVDHDAEYYRARGKAFIRAVLARLTGRCNTLLPFEEVRDRLHLGGPVYRGMQEVPVQSIVGSVNRYRDFDRAFAPGSGADMRRWQALNRAFYGYQELPPVKLYKVGDVYFVLDGHHRVSVAKEHDVTYLDAEVMEVRSRVPLTPDVDADDLEVLGEYDAFLERTKLDTLRPDQNVRLTIAGGYDRLLEHIAVHRYFMGQAEKGEVPEGDAVRHWYDTVYLPVAEVIREQDVLCHFPGRTEADLYLWLMDHLYYLREEHGDVDTAQAAQEFAEEYGEGRVHKLLRGVVRALDAGAELEASPPHT
jgi:hypothetical protein